MTMTVLAAIVALQVSSAPTIVGTVRDGSGQNVRGAVVIVRSASAEQRLVTAADGAFTSTLPLSGEVIVIVRAAGFAEARQSVAAGVATQTVSVVLEPAALSETVTVTASRIR